jgi:putative salt-induced outer membrane protein
MPSKRSAIGGLVFIAAAGLNGATVLADDAPVVPAPAAAPTPPPGFVLLPPPWSGDGAIGYVRTGGNTSTSALNVKLSLDYKGAIWGNSFFAAAFDGSRNKQTTDERYTLSDKVNYNLTPKDYLFGNGSYDNDRFAGIAERYALTVGYGRHVFTTPRQTLDLEAGLGSNYSRDQDVNQFSSHAIATVGGKYVWKITPTSQFSQSLRAEYATNNVYVNPITELKLTVIGNMFAALDFEIRYNSEVPKGIRHTDQIVTINLGYGFGKT